MDGISAWVRLARRSSCTASAAGISHITTGIRCPVDSDESLSSAGRHESRCHAATEQLACHRWHLAPVSSSCDGWHLMSSSHGRGSRSRSGQLKATTNCPPGPWRIRSRATPSRAGGMPATAAAGRHSLSGWRPNGLPQHTHYISMPMTTSYGRPQVQPDPSASWHCLCPTTMTT